MRHEASRVESELVAKGLYALGANFALDGRVTWVPAEVRGYQANNCYLILDERGPLLIDTGLQASREAIVAQLEALLPLGADLYIFVTRPEMDCVGNLSELTERYRVLGNNTKDFYLAELETIAQAAPPVDTARPYVLDLGGLVEEVAPPLKSMLTKWFYHRPTKTLFTSDLFSHVTVRKANASRIASRNSSPPSAEEIHAMVGAKYWWLARSRPGVIADQLRVVFETYDVEITAPSFGCVIRGRDQVRQHYNALLQALP